jgi:hypothetical protein
MSYSNYEQVVILDGFALSGVQSVEANYGISEKPIKVAGVGFIDALVDKPLEGNFSVSREMVSSDPLLQRDSLGNYKFDEQEISGVILYDNNSKGFGFTRARVNQYSISCSVGDIPSIEASLTVYGELGKGVMAGDSSLFILRKNYNEGFDGDYVYLASSSEEFVDQSVNLLESWKNKTLSISDQTYNGLAEDSKFIQYGFVEALGLRTYSSGWYYSDWFFISKKNTSLSLNYSLTYCPEVNGVFDHTLSSYWVFNNFLGWVYVQTSESNFSSNKQMWFSVFLEVQGDGGAFQSPVWMWSDQQLLNSRGVAYLFSPEQNIMQNTWLEFFRDSLGEYKSILYDHSGSRWLGMSGSSVDSSSKLMLEELSLEDINLRQLFAGPVPSATVQDNLLLPASDILTLGKDAFELAPYDINKLIRNSHPPISFPDQSTISIIIDDFNIDAVSDFSFSRAINLQPIYAIPKGTSEDWVLGKKASVKNLEPVQVDTQYPIETDINVTIIVNNYEIREIKDRIQSAPKSNVSIIISDSKTGLEIDSFFGRNVRLVGESISSSVEGEMSISLTYKGYDTYRYLNYE